MNVLVVGGDSYIGSYYCKNSIFSEGILAVSRKKTKIENEFIFPDLYCLPDQIYQNIDIVVSFIGIAHQKEKNNKNIYFNVNRDLVFYIAKQAKINKVKNFIQMSSISVYGDTNELNISKTEAPVTYYGKSKFEGDLLLLSLNDDNFSVTLIRPPMIYGKHAPGNWGKLETLIDKFYILPFKGVQNQRTFLYIKNFQIYLDWIIENKIQGILIITDNFNLSTEEMIRLIIKIKKKKNIIINYKLIIFMKFIMPKIYYKLFGNLQVTNNIVAPKLLGKDAVIKDLMFDE